MPRFLHAADIHLDSNPPRGLLAYEGAPLDAVHGSTRRALVRLVDIAIERSVDCLVIAGDLYDGDWRDARTGLFFVDQVRRLRDAGIATYIIRGNHDAASQITQSLPLPDNPDGSRIVLSHDHPETVRLEDVGLAIHGQGFAERAVTRNLAITYPRPTRGFFNVGMLHTALTGADGHEPYAPCTPEDLLARGYDYWALGHIHLRTPLPQSSEREPILFSGNIQGRHIRETGPKGCYVVDYEVGERPVIEFVTTQHYRWEAIDVDAGGVTDLDMLEEAVGEAIGELFAAAEPSETIAARLSLFGETPLHRTLQARAEAISQRVQAIGVDRSGGRLWLEPVRVRTSLPRAVRREVPDDGPIRQLRGLIESLQADPEAQVQLADPLRDLVRKLPAELPEEAFPHPDDEDWVAELMGEAGALLELRICASESPADGDAT